MKGQSGKAGVYSTKSERMPDSLLVVHTMKMKVIEVRSNASHMLPCGINSLSNKQMTHADLNQPDILRSHVLPRDVTRP